VEIEPRCSIEHCAGIVRRNRKHGDAVERPAGRDDPAGAEQARCRLQPDDIVESRRNAPRAGRIGAERKADEPGGHRHRRAGARAAGYVARIEGIARHAVGRAGADQLGGKLVEVGFADEHRAGSA